MSVSSAQERERKAEDAQVARLVGRIQSGERDAFAEVYETYFDRVYSYLRVMLRSSHEAEDAAQQVFVKAMEALPRYRTGTKPFRAWLFTIARNHALDQLRAKGRMQPEDPAELDLRRDAKAEEEVPALDWISDQDLLLFLERLPDAQRQVLALRFMLDMTTAEIASVLDCKPNDVSVLQYRALTFLRDRLAAIGRGPERRRASDPMRRWVRPARVLRRRRFAML
jgi:RNA polymerase sigma-70 factor (ECF subfamily)